MECVCMGGGKRRRGNGKRGKWKVSEQVEEQEREQVEMEVLLQGRCESKRTKWRRGSERKVWEVGVWVTGEVGYEKEQVGV